MALLAVSAHDIDAAGMAVSAELPLGWLEEELADAELRGEAPGKVDVRLSRSGNDIVVRGKVRADLRTPCARCLKPAEVSIDAELTLLLRPEGGPTPWEEEHEFTAEEADTDCYDGETVVLDPFVREAILLEVPSFPLCSEDCAGIGPAVAAAVEPEAAHVDPRLAPIAALRDKLAGPPASGEHRTAIERKKKKE